ncbi:hypothetical protein [Anaerovibrio slackiae]|uniref:hypothetical protein n=1 Tax=Anaerovibrio slackiae TaxID=2652309 RepID=UPI003866ABF1
MTNRDKFNKISNAELANILNKADEYESKYESCNFCYYKHKNEDCVDKDCVQGIEKWLNASEED